MEQMRQSNMLIPTLKEVPADADIKSHQLLLRAGYIRQIASGIYSYLPLGHKVLKKVEAIVRQEMDKTGANEMLMPAIQPAELWKESGRWDVYGAELMRFSDRHEREFALGATHEEVITSIVRDEIKSYKKLPLMLYQIQTKYRDERRPRFGLLRGREFVMKDAYSFNESPESLDESYQKMYDAYTAVFTRCGLNFRAVIADSGAMGGKDTHEFMVLSEVGEDVIAYSDTSSYAANVEMAPVKDIYEKEEEAQQELQKVETKDQRTMQEVADYLDHELSKGLKSLMFKVDDKLVMVVTRGDHEVNDIKLKNLYDASIVELASEEETKQLIGAGFGSLGPVGAEGKVEIVADYAVKYVCNVSCGANEDGFHYVNANPDRDFQIDTYADLRFIQEGDPSPDGQGVIKFARGIEVGHVFKLGDRYAKALGADYLNDQGKATTMLMGSYGIGVSRTMSAIVEQHNDEKGIVWPKAVSPFDAHLLVMNSKKEEQQILAEEIYNKLSEAKIDVLFDDRKERAGVKFADSDLIGLPFRITVGKNAAEGKVEFKNRFTGEEEEIQADELENKLVELLK